MPRCLLRFDLAMSLSPLIVYPHLFGLETPNRRFERDGRGFKRRRTVGGPSRPCKALVVFQLVAATMRLLQIPQVRRAAASTDGNDLVHFHAHRIRLFDRVVYGFTADAARRLLCEHSLACKIAGLTVEVSRIPAVPSMRHVGWVGRLPPIRRAGRSQCDHQRTMSETGHRMTASLNERGRLWTRRLTSLLLKMN